MFLTQTFFFFKVHRTNLSEPNWTSVEEMDRMDQIGQNGHKLTELDWNDQTGPK